MIHVLRLLLSFSQRSPTKYMRITKNLTSFEDDNNLAAFCFIKLHSKMLRGSLKLKGRVLSQDLTYFHDDLCPRQSAASNRSRPLKATSGQYSLHIIYVTYFGTHHEYHRESPRAALWYSP